MRREGREDDYDEQNDKRIVNDAALSVPLIKDPELRLMFLCCHSVLTEEDRLMLTLKIVSGFTAQDISHVFLVAETTVAQRLARAKRKLRDSESNLIEELSRFQVAERLKTVLKVIYLMFSAGYSPRRGDALILKDVAYEALRLARAVASGPDIALPEAHALAALLAFQASRFEARQNAEGMFVRLRDQDRKLWDQELVAEAMRQLSLAKSGNAVTRYHLEAGIAAMHATAQSWEQVNWAGIQALYTQLSELTASPVVKVSAAIVAAYAGEPHSALEKLETLSSEKYMKNYAPYHIALSDVFEMLGQSAKSTAALEAAAECAVSAPIEHHILNELASRTV